MRYHVTLLTFLIFLLNNIPSYGSNIGDYKHTYTINMKTPDGYTEIRRNENKQYIDTLALETMLRFDTFLHLFVKKRERHRVHSLDIDELSGTVMVVWFQGVKNLDKKNLINITPLSENFLVSSYESNSSILLTEIEKEDLYKALNKRANIKRINAILASFSKYINEDIDNSESVFDKNKIQDWLSKSSKEQEDLDLGLVKSGKGYTIYTWLQAPINNYYYSYGIPVDKPKAVTYVTAKIDDKVLGIIFSDCINSFDDVKISFINAQQYIKDNYNTVQISQSNLILSTSNFFNVLGYVASKWSEKNKLDKAITAYNVLVDDYIVPNPKFLRISYAKILFSCYLLQGNYNAIVEGAPQFLSDALKMKNHGNEVIILYKVLGASYSALREFDKAEDSLNKALHCSLITNGNLSEITIGIQDVLSRTLINNSQFKLAEKHIQNSLLATTEMSGPKWSGTSFGTLMITSSQLRDENSARFYCKIAVAHLLFFQQFDDETWVDVQLSDFLKKSFFIVAQNEKIKETEQDILNILDSKNPPNSTAYNRGSEWMRGPEIELYSRYGEVATALEKAGKYGTEAEKQAARRAFRDWLDSVRIILTE